MTQTLPETPGNHVNGPSSCHCGVTSQCCLVDLHKTVWISMDVCVIVEMSWRFHDLLWQNCSFVRVAVLCCWSLLCCSVCNHQGGTFCCCMSQLHHSLDSHSTSKRRCSSPSKHSPVVSNRFHISHVRVHCFIAVMVCQLCRGAHKVHVLL